MRTILFSLLALLCAPAFADGVPLLLPATSPETAAVGELRAHKGTKEVRSVHQVNAYALDSNVITVAIDGKERTFIGGRTMTGVEGVDTWAGRSGADLLLITRENGVLTASVDTDGLRLRLQRVGRNYALFVPQPIVPEAVTPAMIEAHKTKVRQ